MELINQTSVSAEVLVSDRSAADDGTRTRTGVLVAKATFDVHFDRLELSSQEPLPVFQMEEPTELGILPRDLVPRADSNLEVMVVGAAYGAGGRPTTEASVRLRIGDLDRRMRVVGDRQWIGADEPRISDPLPFLRMPLTWARAFGGSAEIWVDEHSPIEVSDPLNKYGRGFDVAKHCDALRHGWRCPEGFPRPTETERWLPNLEDPTQPIRGWEDAPNPYCWAPMPLDLGLRLAAAGDGLSNGMLSPSDPERGLDPQHFAHPDLRISVPSPGTRVELTGCRPEGLWGFHWPAFRVVADYVVGSRQGTCELRPFMAVLLPDEGRFTISYHHWFRMRVESESSERVFRLRSVVTEA